MNKGSKEIKGSNPILRMDFPDPDVICVDNTFYMISTTMHFMPGGEILRSYDLINWEHAAFVYDKLDSTDAERLCGNKHIYGKGMWAATIRYHQGLFYVIFVCNNTHKTYLYRSGKIEGPWKKSEISGFYHDSSLLFDEGRVYLVHGNRDVYITELNDDLTGPKVGGLNRLLVKDSRETPLGYEGSHIYKINGRYYLFMIHSRIDRWRRVEGCYSADSLDGDFTGGDVFDDDMGFRDSGIAQGGIVESPEGEYNAILFQDSGAVGRIPVVVPVKLGDIIRFGINGKAPEVLSLKSFNTEYKYRPLIGSDDFRYDPSLMFKTNPEEYGCFGLKSIWQFNHEPDMGLVSVDSDEGELWIKTDKIASNIYHCRNTITQRTIYPRCSAEVVIDASKMKAGDTAGLSAFQGEYAWVGIRKEEDGLYAVMCSLTNKSSDVWKLSEENGDIEEKILLNSDKLRVRLNINYEPVLNENNLNECDMADCEILINGGWQKIGSSHKLSFRLDHFTGCRFGLFVFSEKEAGGSAGFMDFKYSVM